MSTDGITAETRTTDSGALQVTFDGFQHLSAGDLLSLRHRGFMTIHLALYYTSENDDTAGAAKEEDDWEVVRKLHALHVEAFVHLDCRVPKGEHSDVAFFRQELDRQLPRLKQAHAELVRKETELKAAEERERKEKERRQQELERLKHKTYEHEQERYLA